MYNCLTYLTQKNTGVLGSCGGFLKQRYWSFPQSSSILVWDFQTNHAAVGYLHDYGNHQAMPSVDIPAPLPVHAAPSWSQG